MQVTVYNNDVGRALKKLKKKMFDEGTIKLLMERRYYEKPSAHRRKKKLEAINRQKKQTERDKEAMNPHSRKQRPKKKKKSRFGQRKAS